MQGNPFSPMGNAFIISAGVASASVPVIYGGAANLNLGNTYPPQLRVLNKGTADVWINFSAGVAGTAAIPVSGTTTLGTPAPVTWAAPGIEIFISIPCAIGVLTSGGNPIAAPPNNQGFWMNLITTVAAQLLSCQLGDGH